MSRTSRSAAATAAAAQTVVNPVSGALAPAAPAVEQEVDDADAVDVFAQFMGEDVEQDDSREEIIKRLLASGKAKRLNGLTVKNVVATMFDTHALLTFVVKEFVVGDTRDANTVDAFGQPLVRLGRTHNVQTSSFAVAGIMKDDPRLAIFASELVDRPDLANMLFAGAKLDVVMQFVAEGEEYSNPFSSNATVSTFERDKMIHHIIGLTLGPVGEDLYRARLLK